MPLKEIGLMLLALVVIAAVGHLWFHTVGGLLEKIKGLLLRRPPQPWHPLPEEPEEEEKTDRGEGGGD